MLKICGKCKEEKDISLFTKDRGKKDGHCTICRDCVRKYRSLPEVRTRSIEIRKIYQQSEAGKEKIKKARAEYYRNNKERSMQQTAEWMRNNIGRVKERRRAHYAANREEINEKRREYRNSNKEKTNEYNRVYRSTNPEKIRSYERKWYEENKHKSFANAVKRKALKQQATPLWANEFFIQEIYRLAKLRTELTGIPHHVDHIVPLRGGKLVCGLHVEHNLQVIPATENLRKRNLYWPQMPDEEKITKAA